MRIDINGWHCACGTASAGATLRESLAGFREHVALMHPASLPDDEALRRDLSEALGLLRVHQRSTASSGDDLEWQAWDAAVAALLAKHPPQP